MITVLYNGEKQQLPAPTTLTDALQLWQPEGSFAVAINETFVPKNSYDHQPLEDGDRIDLLIPMQGG